MITIETKIEAINNSNAGINVKSEIIQDLKDYHTYKTVTNLLNDINNKYGHPFMMDAKTGWMEFDGDIAFNGNVNTEEGMMLDIHDLIHEMSKLCYIKVRYVDNEYQTLTFKF